MNRPDKLQIINANQLNNDKKNCKLFRFVQCAWKFTVIKCVLLLQTIYRPTWCAQSIVFAEAGISDTAVRWNSDREMLQWWRRIYVSKTGQGDI